jgi:nucleoid-associated protein YgaU
MRVVQFLTFLGILAAGACAAWPFRRSEPRFVQLQAATPLLELTLQRTEVPADIELAHAVSPAVGLEAAAASFTTMSYRAEKQERVVDLENLAPPPDLPLAFQPRNDPASISPPSGTGPSRAAWPPRPLAPAPRVRTYRLRDGDTLEYLAERFLGSRGRAVEIFEANRDVLAQPDLLPVGRTLTIPPREGEG